MKKLFLFVLSILLITSFVSATDGEFYESWFTASFWDMTLCHKGTTSIVYPDTFIYNQTVQVDHLWGCFTNQNNVQSRASTGKVVGGLDNASLVTTNQISGNGYNGVIVEILPNNTVYFVDSDLFSFTLVSTAWNVITFWDNDGESRFSLSTTSCQGGPQSPCCDVPPNATNNYNLSFGQIKELCPQFEDSYYNNVRFLSLASIGTSGINTYDEIYLSYANGSNSLPSFNLSLGDTNVKCINSSDQELIIPLNISVSDPEGDIIYYSNALRSVSNYNLEYEPSYINIDSTGVGYTYSLFSKFEEDSIMQNSAAGFLNDAFCTSSDNSLFTGQDPFSQVYIPLYDGNNKIRYSIKYNGNFCDEDDIQILDWVYDNSYEVYNMHYEHFIYEDSINDTMHYTHYGGGSEIFTLDFNRTDDNKIAYYLEGSLLSEIEINYTILGAERKVLHYLEITGDTTNRTYNFTIGYLNGINEIKVYESPVFNISTEQVSALTSSTLFFDKNTTEYAFTNIRLQTLADLTFEDFTTTEPESINVTGFGNHQYTLYVSDEVNQPNSFVEDTLFFTVVDCSKQSGSGGVLPETLDDETKPKLTGFLFIMKKLFTLAKDLPGYPILQGVGSLFYFMLFLFFLLYNPDDEITTFNTFQTALLKSSLIVFIYGIFGLVYLWVELTAGVILAGYFAIQIRKMFTGSGDN